MEDRNIVENCKKSNKKINIFLIIISIMGILLVGVGIAYAFFAEDLKGERITSIKLDKNLTFRYDEISEGLVSVSKMSDNEGINQDDYFDFDVVLEADTATSMDYIIYLTKIEGNLDNSAVKVYLTDQADTQIKAPTRIGDLIDYTDIEDSKVLFTNNIFTSNVATHHYRLRAWLSEEETNLDVPNVNNIEDGLNITYSYTYKFKVGIDVAKQTNINYSKEFAYKKDIDTFVVPADGIYKLEVWGAQGGDCSTLSNDGVTIYNSYGGNGGYSSGEISLSEGEELFIVVGGAGEGTDTRGVAADGGYNGGGNVTENTSVNHVYGAGGGATHIATATGLLSDLSSNQEDVLIVAGGGGGSRNQANHVAEARFGDGGAGGGLSGIAAVGWGDTVSYSVTDAAGSQDSGFAFGKGQDATSQGAGGGGWYGGYSGHSSSSLSVYLLVGPGSGGSGYVKSTLSNPISIAGNSFVPTYDGTSTMVGNKGNGYAKITFISE